MKLLSTIICSILCTATLHAADLDEAIMKEAQKCSDAAVAKDQEKTCAYMPAEVVQAMGGKEAVAASLKQASEYMSSKGISIVSSKVSKPTTRKEIKGTIYAIVPQEIVMKIPQGTLRQKAHMLAISKAPGSDWHFISITKETSTGIMELYPDLLGEITMPLIEKPVLENPAQ
jgi:hypothetical protein